jgi:tight adherence protein C
MTLSLLVLFWLGLALVVVGLSAFAYVLLCAPSRAATQLGIRGFKRQRALCDPVWRAIDRPVRWLGARLGGLLSDKQHALLDRQLVLAGDCLGLSPPEYVAVTIWCLIGGWLVGCAAARATHVGPILAVACGLLGGALPYLLISEQAQSRRKTINRRLPSAIDLIALAMSAGLDFPGAIKQLIDKSSDPNDPLVEELGFVLHKLDLGHTRRQALQQLAERAPTQAVLEFVGAVTQAEERGHPVVRVLQIQATTSREKRSVRAEEAAAKAGVQLVGPLVLMFLAILILVVTPVVLRVGHSGILRG